LYSIVLKKYLKTVKFYNNSKKEDGCQILSNEICAMDQGKEFVLEYWKVHL